MKRLLTSSAIVMMAIILAGLAAMDRGSVALAVGPCTATCYVDGTSGNDGNDGDTALTAKKTIQAAINQVSAGGQVRVLPGTYTESAPGSAPTSLGGTYQFGLFFGSAKPGITLMGVTAADAPITNAAATLATIYTDSDANFGPDGIFVEAANTTVRGLKIGNNVNIMGDNKTIEVVADNFTLRYSTTAIPAGGGSIYINDFSTAGNVVQSYHVLDNIFPDGTSVDISSGAGLLGPVSGREILRNKFDLVNNGYNAVSFNGSGTGVPWFVNSVGGAIIKNNSFKNSTQYIRARGTYDNTQFNWKSYFNDNTYDRAAVALVTVVPFDVRTYSYPNSWGTFNDVRRIGGTIQGEIDHALAGDTVLLKPGTYPTTAQILIDRDLTIKGQGGPKPVITPPATLPASIDVDGAWFLVSAGNTFNLKNVELNGTGFSVWQAIRSHGTANIDNVDFRTIQGALYRGVAIESFGGIIPGGAGSDTHGGGGPASALTVTNSTFKQIGRIGVLVKGSLSTANIGGNTYTGKGAVDGLDYAFEAGAGGVVVITGNKITGNLGVASADGSTSAGILATTFWGPGTAATITGNRITGNTDGIAVGFDEFDAAVVGAHRNDLSHNASGINSTQSQVNGTCNWWGSSSGPGPVGPGTGSNVTLNVTFLPWLKSANLKGKCTGGLDDEHGDDGADD